jgi:phage terminase small subunit
MPALKNPRHEAFALELFHGIAEGVSHGAAYTRAGYTANGNAARANACRLLKSASHIIERVAELQREAAKDKQVSVASILQELETAREIAQENKQPAAMISASMGKAKIAGIDVERIEQGRPGDFSAAQSTRDIAESLLAQAASPNIEITEEMIDAAIDEMDRHIAKISVIAAGNISGQQH